MKHIWQGNKKKEISNEVVEQMAKDYKAGAFLKNLKAKYKRPIKIIRNKLKAFEAPWFDYKMITATHRHNCEDACNNYAGAYKNFARTLRDIVGLHGEEITTVTLALSKRIKSEDENIVNINPGIARCILQKTNSKVVTKLLEPYV